jgi:hypothetical protein
VQNSRLPLAGDERGQELPTRPERRAAYIACSSSLRQP